MPFVVVIKYCGALFDNTANWEATSGPVRSVVAVGPIFETRLIVGLAPLIEAPSENAETTIVDSLSSHS